MHYPFPPWIVTVQQWSLSITYPRLNPQKPVNGGYATRAEHIGVDFELYLPQKWTEDSALRAKTRIPKDLTFKTRDPSSR